MKKIWNIKTEHDPADVQKLVRELKISDLMARLLLNRNITTYSEADNFFNPKFENLHDPFLMKDMDRAVNRLTEALHNSEKILVYGDYDVDGTTAVTLVYSFLKEIGAHCDYYIPDRYKEGYGFSFDGVDYAAEHHFGLIITLDCGIKDGARIDYARQKQIDVIVCDHHNPSEIPDAGAVLDPKRPDCAYPDKGLSGCGVGFKLLQAFCIQQDLDQAMLMKYLDLLTISIGADIVPLMGENRILASLGLRSLAEHKRPGVAAMLKQAGFEKENLTITDVVFLLAPRINAAGRIFSGKQAVELLLCENEEEATSLSKLIEDNNNTRKGLDKSITAEARQIIEEDTFYHTSFTTVVKSSTWHKGVVGIVASRLIEEHYKPTIVLVEKDGKLSGSARSIKGIDLYDVLGECSHLLEQYGGHAMAAGLSMKAENFEKFREHFDHLITRIFENERPVPTEEYEAEIQFETINDRLVKNLNRFAPFGPENMKPCFLIRNVTNARFTRTVGADNLHLKLHLKQNGIEMNGIGFNLGKWKEPIADNGLPVDILCTLEENVWNNQTTIQLQVKDIRLAEPVSPEIQNENQISGSV